MSREEKEVVVNDEFLIEEYPPKDRKGFVAWIKEHKNQLILIGISIPTIIAVVLSLKNKDAIKALWEKLNAEIEKTNLYSPKWFEAVNEEVLSTEREKVRLAYCSSGDNFSEASRFQNLLWRFDNEMSKRAWGDEIPHATCIPREHSRYLLNDD